MKKIYLATPYYHESPLVMEWRFEKVTKKAAELIQKGYIVFSPITHCHPMAVRAELSRGWDFWREYDKAFLEWCDEVWVLKQGGFEESIGVKNEVEIAQKMNKPVIYIDG